MELGSWDAQAEYRDDNKVGGKGYNFDGKPLSIKRIC